MPIIVTDDKELSNPAAAQAIKRAAAMNNATVKIDPIPLDQITDRQSALNALKTYASKGADINDIATAHNTDVSTVMDTLTNFGIAPDRVVKEGLASSPEFVQNVDHYRDKAYNNYQNVWKNTPAAPTSSASAPSNSNTPNLGVTATDTTAAPHIGFRTLPERTSPAPTPQPIDPEKARAMIEQSMISGVPTAEFEKYGGYDKVYQMAQQAGLAGSPRIGGLLAANAQGDVSNATYSYDYSYKNAGNPALNKDAFFGGFVPDEYRSYIPDSVDDYASLAALAVANDPANATKTLDQVDWSFLKPKSFATYSPPPPPAISEYQAVTREVNPETDTVQGQLDNILDEDSPLMRRAKAMALADMAGRGLLNSSLATTAGYAAMIDKALPIAQQDAETYFKQGLTNQDYRNQAALTNVNWRNKFLEDSYVTQLDFWNQSNLMAQQHEYDIDTLNKTNEWKSKLLATEYDFKQKLQQDTIDADLQTKYISTYTDMLKQLDAILADPDIDDKSKEVMINKYVEAVQKMSDSLETVGAPMPEFDFSQYYIGGGLDTNDIAADESSAAAIYGEVSGPDFNGDGTVTLQELLDYNNSTLGAEGD